jgi:hypothetical protein
VLLIGTDKYFQIHSQATLEYRGGNIIFFKVAPNQAQNIALVQRITQHNSSTIVDIYMRTEIRYTYANFE